MSRRGCASYVAGLVLLPLALSGCDLLPQQQRPPETADIVKAVGEMYLSAGVASEVSAVKILGKHYRPAQDSWKAVVCIDFVMGESGIGRDCNDSFEVYLLDTGDWMVNGTINGAYRWQQLPRGELTSPGS